MSLEIFAVFFWSNIRCTDRCSLLFMVCQARGIWDPPNPCSHISIIYFAISGIIWLTRVGAERGHNKWGGRGDEFDVTTLYRHPHPSKHYFIVLLLLLLLLLLLGVNNFGLVVRSSKYSLKL